MNINLPETSVSDIAGSASTVINDLGGIAALLIGIFLALFILDYLIGAIMGKNKNESDT